MQKRIKILTLICAFVSTFFLDAYAASVNQKAYNTHLRWSFKAPKKALTVEQSGTNLEIKTLDKSLFENLRKDFVTLQTNSKYIKSFEFNSRGLPYNPAVIKVKLKDLSVEMFSFYKDSENKLMVDFWINQDLATKISKVSKLTKAPVKKVKRKKLSKKKKSITRAKKKVEPKKVIVKASHRDFRYGSAFFWNYAPSIPSLKKDVDVRAKAPNYLYEVKDRVIDANEREAHMQLGINFYRKSKWGLMSKSIELYEKKYGKDQNKEINDFMKATSLVKNLLNPKIKVENISKESAFQAAVNMLSTISSSSQDYALVKASTRYVLQVALDKEDYVKSLQLSKKLYVASSEQLDDEMIIYSSKAILHSLAHLRQLGKIKEFLRSKAVMRVLPKQIGHAYISFVHLSLKEEGKVVKEYESRKKGIVGVAHPTIIFNTAEAYFRTAQYQKAIKLYDDYIANYSFLSDSSQARLRLALSYDILEKKSKEIKELYKSAINKSSDVKTRYEAKIRYVGYNLLRKLALTKLDLEEEVFLEQSIEEKASIDKNMQRLLWLTRLRLFLVKEQYQDALAYLSTIPLDSQPSLYRNVFMGDGSEAVFGLIKASYLKQNFSQGIKVWEIYKEKYGARISKDPYLKYIVTDSYLKIGLNKSFNKSFTEFKKMSDGAKKTFPVWVKRHKNSSVKDYIVDLDISKMILEKKWSQLDTKLTKLQSNRYINYNFYKALVSYKKEKYNKAVEYFEALFLDKKNLKRLSPAENRQMLKSYIESLYETGPSKKFRKNIAALVGDLRRSEDNNVLTERAEYLLLESVFSGKYQASDLVRKTSEFLKEFKKSAYKARVKYLKGIALLKNKKEEEGKKVLSQLLEEKDTPEYLKGLARSELTTLVLKNRQL